MSSQRSRAAIQVHLWKIMLAFIPVGMIAVGVPAAGLWLATGSSAKNQVTVRPAAPPSSGVSTSKWIG